MKVLAAGPAAYAEAAGIIREGGIVAYPTETVYGLAVDPCSATAVASLFHAKGRGSESAVLLIVADEEQLDAVVREVSSQARRCMAAFWPGPLTLLFPKAAGLPDALTAGSDMIAVRCPASAEARGLCSAYGGALTSTSANRTGAPPAMCVEELNLDGVALAIDGGRLPSSRPSTLYDPETGRVLREGVISEETLRRVLG